jgi:hypothetical protein
VPLLTPCQNRSWATLLLEILRLLIADEDPERAVAARSAAYSVPQPAPAADAPVAAAAAPAGPAAAVSQGGGGRGSRLLAMLERDQRHRAETDRALPTRHTRFGGVFVERDAVRACSSGSPRACTDAPQMRQRHILSRQAGLVLEPESAAALHARPPLPQRRRIRVPSAVAGPAAVPFVSSSARAALAAFAEQVPAAVGSAARPY